MTDKGSTMSSPRGAVAVGVSLGLWWLLLATGVAAQDIVPAHSLKGLLEALAKRTNAAAGVAPDEISDVDIEIVAVLTSLEVSTAPFGTSTGGLTFQFDSQLGTFTRSTESFGPIFGRRSITIGKGKASAGFNWLHAGYDSLGGLDLGNWDLRPVQNARATPARGGGRPVSAVPSYSALKLNLTSDTYVGFGTYGVTNDFDIGVAVPWVRISLDADVGLFTSSDADITPGQHQLVIPRTVASGVGDIAVFGKYRVWRQGEGGVAAEIEVRLPTGDTNSLRGTGVTRTLLSAIWSRGGTVSPHAHVGYEFWSSGIPLTGGGTPSVKDQINYSLGLEWRAHPRTTVLADVVGRRLLGAGQLGYRTETLTTRLGPVTVDALVPLPEALDVVSFAPGVKWNVGGRVLLTGSVLAAISNKGLRANVIPVVGVDWAF